MFGGFCSFSIFFFVILVGLKGDLGGNLVKKKLTLLRNNELFRRVKCCIL